MLTKEERQSMKTTALIMAGGRGERFWPKSRKSTPKQFLSLTNSEKTICARKLQRMAKLIGLPYTDVTVAVTGLSRRIEGMKRSFGIPMNLKGLGIDPQEVMKQKDSIIEAALADACTKTNPRKVTAEDIEGILKKVTPL